jgi:hypothetical protein
MAIKFDDLLSDQTRKEAFLWTESPWIMVDEKGRDPNA